MERTGGVFSCSVFGSQIWRKVRFGFPSSSTRRNSGRFHYKFVHEDAADVRERTERSLHFVVEQRFPDKNFARFRLPRTFSVSIEGSYVMDLQQQF